MRALIKALRPHQWVKNLFVLVPALFAKKLLSAPTVISTASAFIAFCALASAVYIFNDLRDIDADRAHPVKRLRAIASGVLSIRAATIAALILALGSMVLVTTLPSSSAVWLLGYAMLNLAYTLKLKHIAYLDVLCIAAGFELRVLFGAAAAQVVASEYLLAVTFLLALFLGFGKRLHEIKHTSEPHQARRSLGAYHVEWLSRILLVTALATLAVYVVYCLDPHTRAYFATDYLIVSAPFAALGMGRFMFLVRSASHLDSPTDTMIRDRWFIANLALWAITVLMLIR